MPMHGGLMARLAPAAPARCGLGQSDPDVRWSACQAGSRQDQVLQPAPQPCMLPAGVSTWGSAPRVAAGLSQATPAAWPGVSWPSSAPA